MILQPSTIFLDILPEVWQTNRAKREKGRIKMKQCNCYIRNCSGQHTARDRQCINEATIQVNKTNICSSCAKDVELRGFNPPKKINPRR